MAGTFSKMYVHIVFAVKGRKNLITSAWEQDLYKYITGMIKNKDQKPLAVNGMPDHIHILVNIKPGCAVSELVREIKKASNNYIKENKFTPFNFQWQEGFGAFTYEESAINRVIKYINNQKAHHTKATFKEEYKAILDKFNVDYKEEYLFD